MLPAIFHTQLWYTPESQRNSDFPAEFLLKTFPYSFLNLFELTDEISKLDGVSSNPIERSILEYCIVDYRNIGEAVEEKLPVIELIRVLPVKIINDLLSFIFSFAMYDLEFMSVLENSIHSVTNPRFADESWKCENCQKRRLDRQRNCPFLPKEDHDPKMTYPTHSGVVTECPLGNVNTAVVNRAAEAYRYRKQALLPEEGGIRNQTVFFMIASQKFEEIINYYEQKRAQEASK